MARLPRLYVIAHLRRTTVLDAPLSELSVAQTNLYHVVKRDVVRRYRHATVDELNHRLALLRNTIVPQTDYLRYRAEHDAYTALISRKECAHV